MMGECQELKNGRKIPFVTVVTDLGEAHPWWFNKGLNRLFVPTQEMKDQVTPQVYSLY